MIFNLDPSRARNSAAWNPSFTKEIPGLKTALRQHYTFSVKKTRRGLWRLYSGRSYGPWKDIQHDLRDQIGSVRRPYGC